MSLGLRIGLWAAILALLLLTPALGTFTLSAQETELSEVLLSLAMPSDSHDQAEARQAGIDQLLSGRSIGNREPGVSSGEPAVVGPVEVDLAPTARDASATNLQDDSWPFFPGSTSLRSIQQRWIRVASVRPVGAHAARREANELIDLNETFESAGRLVQDPTSVFSSFEIRVNIGAYELRLFGIKGSGEKRLIFHCRTGLGSPDYPTPTGSFYVMRIFDDKPLWIPPPDRDWAWGQAPSHSVYGGHMMPFFTKKPALTARRGGDTVTDLDCVESEMEMVDAGMYRIHGTDSPWSVGSSQSHGCVRLLNRSVKQLADALKMYVGTTERGRSANGPYVDLARPVRLVLYR